MLVFLKELEAAGIVQRQLLASPARGTAYALTEDGRALEPVLVALGRWGAPHLGEPREGEVVTPASFAMALRTTFRGDPDGRSVTYEVIMGGIVATAAVDGDAVEVQLGSTGSADLVIRSGPDLKRLMAGDVTPAAAPKEGLVEVSGPRELLTRFARTYQI